MKKKRLAIISTHPIQYNVPLFRLMHEADVSFATKVFYTLGKAAEKVFDKEFGREITWDIPLLEGYDCTFVNNTSSNPGTQSFNGVVNPTLISEIEAWKADAILVYGWAFSGHLKAMRHFYKKVPVIFRGDSTLLDEPAGFSIKKLARRTLLRWVYHHVDYALYVGSANRKYFLANGLQPRQLLFAPHAVENNRFANKLANYDEQAQKWRQELGLNKADVVFLFAGKLTPKKDPALLIASFLNLKKENTKLVIVGNGKLENSLKKSYKDCSNIIFIDFKNQGIMPVVYRLADVFVLPSKGPGETWGLAVNEAMACGRAVIASDKCGCSYDLISEGKNGYVFKSENEESLTECMRNAMKNFEQFGNESSQIIKKWNYDETIAQLQGLANKIMLDEES